MRRSLKTTRASGGKKSFSVTRLDATFSQSVILASRSSAPARYLAGGERAGRERHRRTSLRRISRIACSGKSVRSSRRRFARARSGSSKGMTCDKYKRKMGMEISDYLASAIALSLKMLMFEGISVSDGGVVSDALQRLTDM